MVFEGGVWIRDGVRKWEVVGNVILIVIIGRDGTNGVNDGVFAGPRIKG